MAAGEKGNLESFLKGGFGDHPDHAADGFNEKFERAEVEKMHPQEKPEVETVSGTPENRRRHDEIEEMRSASDHTSLEGNDQDQLQRRLEEALRDNTQLELQCRSQLVEWDAERNDFRVRVKDLEGQVLEWMERSHNTHRDTQSNEHRMEAELASHKRLLEIEYEKKLRVEQVRGKKTQRALEGEIERLKKELYALSVGKTSLVQRLFGRRQ